MRSCEVGVKPGQREGNTMDDTNFGSGGNEGEGRQHPHHHEKPYWKRLHHSWLFWIGFALVSVAITVYVMSDNLALMPHGRAHKPLPGQLGQ